MLSKLKNSDFVKTLKEKDLSIFSAPLSISFEITSQCNLKCRYCYTDAGEKQEKELEKKEILNLFDHLNSIGVGTLVFTGGEPLHRPDFFEIARYANELDFTITLSTNGTLLDTETAFSLASTGFKRVQVSIEGNEEQHEALTGVKGSYRKAMNALENLERAGITCVVATTITALNAKSITSHVERIRDETPASSIRFLRFLPMGRGEKARDFDVSLEEIEKICLEIEKLRKKINRRFEINFSDSFNAPFFDRPSHPCIGGHSWCCITPEGYVVPCNYFSSPDVARAIGADNIREKKVIDIWQSSLLFQQFRNPQNVLKGKCRTCDFLKECRGGCRAISYSYTGDLFDVSPLCSYGR